MSRAIGAGAGQFMGARVAGELSYVLPHVKNGKAINAKVTIPIFVNNNKGTNRDGSAGRSDRYRLVAWGKLADICVKNLPKGKAIDIFVTPQSYPGKVYNGENVVLKSDGTPLTTEKVEFKIDKIIFGEESLKEIENEVQAGTRPQFWNVPGHADSAKYTQLLKDRQQVQYTGGQKFGYARVIVPSGPGVTLANQTPVNAPATTAAPAETPVAVDANLLAAVQAALNGQPVVPAPRGQTQTTQATQAAADEVPF